MNVKKILPVFTDERGSILDIISKDTINHVGYFFSKKDAIRGKHFHKEQKQYTIVIKGKVRIFVKNLLEKDSKIEKFELEKMEMILFPPFCYHAIEAIEDSECLVLTSKSREGTGYEEDTIRVEDIENYNFE